LVDFIDQHSLSTATKAARERVARQLSAFLSVSDCADRTATYLSVSLEQVLFFLFDRFRQGLAAATIRRDAALLDAMREAEGLPTFRREPALLELLRAVARARPTGAKFLGTVVYAPHQLVPHLLDSDTFEGLRERALFTMRVTTLARGGSAHSIRRSSIRTATDPINRSVVVFNYDSKGSHRANVAHDSNYVEHLADDQRHCNTSLCPAHLLLRLKARVDQLDIDEHDALFTSSTGTPLRVATVNRIITNLLRRANIAPVYTSHSLRLASSVALKLHGVDNDDVCVRAGWATSSTSSTRTLHYLHGRAVRDNFAKLLLLPGTYSSD
jgi:hypothetical protein